MVAVTTKLTVVVNNRVLFLTLDGPVKRDVEQRATRVRRAIAANAPKGRPRQGPRGRWRGDQDPTPRTRLSNPRSYFIGPVDASEAGPRWTVRVGANEATAPHAKWVIFGTGTRGRAQTFQGAGGRIAGSSQRGRIVPTRAGKLVFPDGLSGGRRLVRRNSVAGQGPKDYMSPAIRAAR